MPGRLAAQSCPQVHRRDPSKNPRACGPCGQLSDLTPNTVASLVCCPKESAERKWEIASFRRSPRHLRRDKVLAGEIGALARYLRARTVSRGAHSVLVCTSRSVSIGVEDFGSSERQEVRS
jgi:hypothetical protein